MRKGQEVLSSLIRQLPTSPADIQGLLEIDVKRLNPLINPSGVSSQETDDKGQHGDGDTTTRIASQCTEFADDCDDDDDDDDANEAVRQELLFFLEKRSCVLSLIFHLLSHQETRNHLSEHHVETLSTLVQSLELLNTIPPSRLPTSINLLIDRLIVLLMPSASPNLK